MLRKISQGPGGKFPLFKKTDVNTSVPTHVTLPTMSSNNSMKTTVLPLGYHSDVKPDQTKQGDLLQCNISSQDENCTLLHGCFHSFHDEYLNGTTS